MNRSIGQPRRGTWTQADLARHVGVSRETVRRTLHEMMGGGIPLERQPDGGQVYWSVPKRRFPGGIVLRADDAQELLRQLARAPWSKRRDELMARILDAAKGKVEAVPAQSIVSPVATEMLDEALKRYRNRAVTTLEVIEELIALAKRVREDRERGTNLGLSAAEVAFYDALADNKSALDLMGEPILVKMSQELAKIIRQNATIDWNLRETVRARLRSLVRRLLRKYKYPPDLQEKATETVLKQAEMLAKELAA